MSASRPELLTQSLLALPDPLFFELLRNWLGPISTPYRKQDLLQSLRARLTEPERKARIMQLLDPADLELLWALDAAGSAGLDALSRVVMPENPAAVHRWLVNLQDRLLVYRSDRDGRYRINPWFADEVEAKVRQEPCEAPRSKPWEVLANRLGTLVIALASLAREDGRVRRRDGELRQAFADQITARLGAAQADTAPMILRAMENTGLLRPDATAAGQGSLRLSERALTELVELDAVALLGVLLAAAADRGGLAGRATAWEQVLRVLACQPVSRETAVRLGQLSFVIHGSDQSFALDDAITAGILLEHSDDTIGPASVKMADQSAMVDSSLQLVLGPDLDRRSVLNLSRHTRLVRLESSSTWEITRDSVYRWLESGAETADILNLVSALVPAVPAVLETSLRDWSEAFAGARWYRGIVLTIAEGRRALLVHDRDFQALSARELAPGVYLVDEERWDLLTAFAERNGLPAPPPPPGSSADEPEHRGLALGVRPQVHRVGLPPSSRPLPPPPPSDGDPDLKQGPDGGVGTVGATLASLEGKIPDAALSEARVRIERKLIVDSEQLGWIEAITEGLEARGLDYSAKIRVIETALRDSGSVLEVTRSVSGSRSVDLLEPSELQREGQSMLLIGRKASAPEQRMRIDVSKISRVRRLRASLTGGPLR